MKKIVSIIIAVFMAVGFSCALFFNNNSNLSFKASAQVTENSAYRVDETYAKNVLYDFIETNSNSDRSYGTDGELKAGKYVAEKFYGFGLKNYFGATEIDLGKTDEQEKIAEQEKYFQKFTGSNSYTNEQFSSQNIVGFLPSKLNPQTDDTLVIGAHYDNVYNFKTIDGKIIGGQGAYDNGTGVATMLSIVNTLKDKDIPFNVVFVAFGAEEIGLVGSENFVMKMKADRNAHFSNTLLMFNLDVVGAGDYMYLYTDEVKRGHDSFLRSVAKEIDIPVKKNPIDKKILLLNSGFGDYGYTHVGQMSDHASFYNQGINTAFMFTFNWNTQKKYGMVESSKHPAIMHTTNDTLAKLEEYYSETYVKYMNNAGNLITMSVAQGDAFASAMRDSYATKPNNWFWINSKYALYLAFGVVGVMIGVVVLLWFVYRKKEKKLPPEQLVVVTQNTKDTSVFGDELEGNKDKKEKDDSNNKKPPSYPTNPDPFDNF